MGCRAFACCIAHGGPISLLEQMVAFDPSVVRGGVKGDGNNPDKSTDFPSLCHAILDSDDIDVFRLILRNDPDVLRRGILGQADFLKTIHHFRKNGSKAGSKKGEKIVQLLGFCNLVHYHKNFKAMTHWVGSSPTLEGLISEGAGCVRRGEM
ncbi:hypothetical protein ScalyP_jg6358 [Parmales sp. scaly parma]|nr:hypothetical protein ScalyP_jg6358 [Parmales sp. scaly parma]